MKRIAVSIACIALLISCREEITIIKVITPSWISHPSFTLTRKVKFNSFSDGNSLFLYGPESFSVLTKDFRAKHYPILFDYPFGKKFPINNNFFVSATSTGPYLGFWPVTAPDLTTAVVYLDAKGLDEYFIKVNFDLFSVKESMSINSSNQCLLPYYSNHPDNKISLFLIEIGNLTQPNLYLKNAKRITLNEPGNIAGANVSYVKAIDDFFFVSTASKTYQLLSDGTVKLMFNYRIIEAFKRAGDLCVVNELNQIAKSSDNGKTWEDFIETSQSFTNGSCYSLGDSLVINSLDAIFSIKFKSTKYTFRELRNDGLAGNAITSITQFNDSIYVTTPSGVFYKSRKEFFNSKK